MSSTQSTAVCCKTKSPVVREHRVITSLYEKVLRIDPAAAKDGGDETEISEMKLQDRIWQCVYKNVKTFLTINDGLIAYPFLFE